MSRFGKAVVKLKIPILIIAVLLLVPSLFGMLNTRINYDMLDYLPGDIDTVKGQEILLDDFGKGAFSIVVIEGMTPKEISDVKDLVEEIDHVETVIWYDSIADVSIPMELLPDKYYDVFNKGDATLMAIFFDTSTSADETMEAISEIRKLMGKQCFVTGMSAMVTDLKELCETEEPVYVGLAVLCATVVMMIFMDSFLIPFIFLASIGMAILLNLGTNIMFGEISYITKALSAVLQLGVTMDYSIFLWHSYTEEKQNYDDKESAMASAIGKTLSSVVGSSITTVAGFLALCFMSFTLGKDLGIVMAKGVVFGVIGCVTTLPAMILVFDKAIEKTKHKSIIPNMDKFSKQVVKLAPVFIILFLAIVGPAFYGYQKAGVYYDLSESLPEDMNFVIANTKLQDEFDMGSTHMILVDSATPQKQMKEMMDSIEEVEGVKAVLGLETIIGSLLPETVLPESVTEILESDNYKLLMISSQYKVATDEVNAQINDINNVLKKYDPNGMLIGEAPCTKDLIEITDHDFMVVSWLSIAAIFIIILFVFKSLSLPVLLVAVIEFAIFINLGIPYFTQTSLPFVAPICISTIQLGATVDYTILMTTRYKRERFAGLGKKEAAGNALSASIPSIIVSAFGFFAATFGVGMYSEVDMISSMCLLMARGSMVSMVSVILVLPSLLRLFDKLICVTSIGFVKKKKMPRAVEKYS